MTVGERIKQARHMRRLSQRELASRAEVSAQAVSKYERDLNTPSSGVLLRLSKALDLKVEFFVRPKRVVKISPEYRKRTALPRKLEESIKAGITDWLERYLEIEEIVHPGGQSFGYPDGFPRKVSSEEEVEEAAVALRRAWQLGLDPIENLTEILEDRGVKMGLVDFEEEGGQAPPKAKHFDACAFSVEDGNHLPVIVTRQGIPGDRQRFSLAHELGHLMLETADGLKAERAANRFAGAFLVPRDVARFELGSRRSTFNCLELHVLKHKYGLSMAAWVHRARDLEIIPEGRYLAIVRSFRANGWHLKEPGRPYPAERPARLERLVMSALAEDLISRRRASELLGRPLEEFESECVKEHGDHGWLLAVCG